jgi:hypothetical protein
MVVPIAVMIKCSTAARAFNTPRRTESAQPFLGGEAQGVVELAGT